MTDKNLFLYDLAVVAIMKNEGPYIKEWLDYHLLAGADHFYIYDNESPDNLKEVLQPYIDAGIVTYKFFPGKSQQFPAYNDAIRNYKFFCRYMAFIDGDEFIFPQSNKNIVEVVDEILADKPYAGALAMNWHMFGSNYHEKADYSKGVLERFTRRADTDNPESKFYFIKDIVIPKHTDFFDCPHKINHFDNYFTLNEDGTPIFGAHNNPPTCKKMVVNHYSIKSREEYLKRINRGDAIYTNNPRSIKMFEDTDKVSNEIFDDSIIKYRDKKLSEYKITGGGGDTKISSAQAT